MSCGGSTPVRPRADVALPVVPGGGQSPHVRPSTMSRRRATVLILVHVLMIGHVLHWLWAGRTLSPVEPSEAMYTLNKGYLNAGAIFFALAILATLIFGRFLCGWGCHLVAYQDLCAWLLRKIGIRPKAFRSRLLVFAPLALAIYMFVWPTAYRVWLGAPAPTLANHLVTAEFWATFPGPVIAILTILGCGFAIVYFLGSKGFCTYACPYGGFFGLVEPLAPGRILVTDACEHCGHCTSACTSNVRVHEEVAKFGMVVDPGCMKCMDCVTVCPNDALYFGFAKPAIAVRTKPLHDAGSPIDPGSPFDPAAPINAGAPADANAPTHRSVPTASTGMRRETSLRREKVYDFTPGEELAALGVGIVALLALRGLYGQIPLLFAMGLAAMTAFVAVKLGHMIASDHVRWQNLQLKRGRRWTRAGRAFFATTALWLAFVAHGGVIQGYAAWGSHIVARIALGDDLWSPGMDWWARASTGDRQAVEAALHAFERAQRWGFLVTPGILPDQARLYLAKGDGASAEQAVRRFISAAPHEAAGYRGLANVLRKVNRGDEAVEQYRNALRIDPGFFEARAELCGTLEAMGRWEEAAREYEQALTAHPDDPQTALTFADLLVRHGDAARAKGVLSRVASAVPGAPQSIEEARLRTRLGIGLLSLGDVDAGIGQLRLVVESQPGFGDAQYNLGYALLTQDRTSEAIPHLRRAVAARSDVALWHYNLGVAMFMSGDPSGALPSIREAIRLSPNDAQMHGFLGVLLEALGDSAGAAEVRARAERLRSGG